MKSIGICGDNRHPEYTKVREACRGFVIEGGNILLAYEVNTDQWFLPGGTGSLPVKQRKDAWNMKNTLRLRPYKSGDAEAILSWIKDADTFHKWSTDRYDHYPITGADMNHKYIVCNGDCPEPDNFYPMTAFDDSGIVGHLILRFTDPEKAVIRFGFVIVDDSKRGMGYGKQMLQLALSFAFDILKAKKVTLGVLENNPGAYHCYKAAGFRDVTADPAEYYTLMGRQIKCLELETERG